MAKTQAQIAEDKRNKKKQKKGILDKSKNVATRAKKLNIMFKDEIAEAGHTVNVADSIVTTYESLFIDIVELNNSYKAYENIRDIDAMVRTKGLIVKLKIELLRLAKDLGNDNYLALAKAVQIDDNDEKTVQRWAGIFNKGKD
jgi:hypothetical protein